jgi:HAE1 family hydrophobic/amphiphilic exporter-1
MLPPMPSMARIGVVGGNVLTLSLNEALRLALENNNEIEVVRGEVLFGEAVLRSLEAFYDPVFSLTPEINHSSTPTASSLGGSDRSGAVKNTDLNFNSSVIKPFRKGGGRYEMFFNNTRETTSSTFAQLSPFYSSSFGVQLTQPLLRNRPIDINRHAIRVQRKLLAQTDADFRRRTMDIITQVQRAYWEMAFALRERENQVANVNLARELFRQTEMRIISNAPKCRPSLPTARAS